MRANLGSWVDTSLIFQNLLFGALTDVTTLGSGPCGWFHGGHGTGRLTVN